MKRILLTCILPAVISFAMKAQTNVSGNITGNTTWTKANSPYVVTDTVTVFPGDTLTIEPGVTVKFYDNQLLIISPILINPGILIAVGTITDSITFTSNSSSPTPGIYAGISGRGEFNYCNFKYASVALDGKGIIKNSTFIHNVTGINSTDPTEIDSCTFIRNTQTGVNGNEALSLNDCSFYFNNYGIITYAFTVTLTNCIIEGNGTGADVTNYDFENCIINNNQTGILGIDNGPNILNNCTIDSNATFGIQYGAQDGGDIMNCQIENNGTGIDVWYDANDGSAFIAMNDIENNATGINITYGGIPIYCNTICSNTSYNFVNNGVDFAMPDNYWCITDSATIASHILDGHDSINLGLVTFMPLDTGVCYLATGMPINASPDFSFTIFPNPASDNLTLLLPENVSKANIKIFDLLGKIQCTSAIAKQETNMDVSLLARGIFIVEVSYGDAVKRQKFIRE